MKKFLKQFRYGQKGFTLVELLVVVAILGVLAAVAVPNVSKFINQGKTEAKEVELHNVQTAVTAMMTEATSGQLDQAFPATQDMSTITATAPDNTVLPADPEAFPDELTLDTYMTGLNDTSVKSNYQYAFTIDGVVTQSVAP